MSYCAIITFKNSKIDAEIEFRNSYGGAARIWTSLFDRYLKDDSVPYDCWMNRACVDDGHSLWGLAKCKALSMCERAVHTATFDYAIVEKKNFKQFVKHLREFTQMHPVGSEFAHHLEAWAQCIENLDDDVESIGFYGTSCGENLWRGRYDQDKEEHVAYDLKTGDKHFDVYDAIKY